MTTRSDQSCRSLPRQTSWASPISISPVSASFFICAGVILIFAPFQMICGSRSISLSRTSPSVSGRSRGTRISRAASPSISSCCS
ncbi:hypothetical protein [Rhizobium phaseoli]|uniref:hypothetical protein n=1 Tax=Rhizobium phaseoli TaxID=396 RepID=UPI001FCD2D17|nr:hypothetical protein [Rhizobium phaseoli]